MKEGIKYWIVGFVAFWVVIYLANWTWWLA